MRFYALLGALACALPGHAFASAPGMGDEV